MAFCATRRNQARTLHGDESALRNRFAQAFFDTIGSGIAAAAPGSGKRLQLNESSRAVIHPPRRRRLSSSWRRHTNLARLILKLTRQLPGRYDVLWRTPLNAGMPLPIVLKFPDGVDNVREPATRELPDSLVERRIIKVTDSLAGKRIDFVGLQATITDVLVRVKTAGRQRIDYSGSPIARLDRSEQAHEISSRSPVVIRCLGSSTLASALTTFSLFWPC